MLSRRVREVYRRLPVRSEQAPAKNKGASKKASIYRSFGAQIFHLLNSKGEDQSHATTLKGKT
jgi:hypothetical protein